MYHLRKASVAQNRAVRQRDRMAVEVDRAVIDKARDRAVARQIPDRDGLFQKALRFKTRFHCFRLLSVSMVQGYPRILKRT